jgi:hypothetical protein
VSNYEIQDDKVVVQLIRPIEFDGIKHSSVTLRELTVEENLELDKASGNRTSLEQDIHYFAKMAGKPAGFMLVLKERDWKRLKNIYWETLGNVELELTSSE